MKQYKWIKQHPLSACSVGDIEFIEDEARVAELKESKYITPYDPTTDTVEEVDTVQELNKLSKENDQLKAENEELKKENKFLLEEINIFKAPKVDEKVKEKPEAKTK